MSQVDDIAAKYGATDYKDPVADAEKKYGLPKGLLHSILHEESNGNPNATSSTGAKGWFQFMPKTGAAYGVKDPSDIDQSADAAGRYISDLHKQFGSYNQAVAAYNMGPSALSKLNGQPPSPGVQSYTSRVMAGAPDANVEDVAAKYGALPYGMKPNDPRVGQLNNLDSNLPGPMVTPKEQAVKDASDLSAIKYNPVGTLGEGLLAGIGKSFVNTGRGIRDFFTGNRPDPETTRLDEPLATSGPGIIGDMGGQAAQMLVPGKLARDVTEIPSLAKAAATAKPIFSSVAPALAKISPAAAKLLPYAGDAAVSGGFSAAQPVNPDETRAGNAAAGAVAGAAGRLITKLPAIGAKPVVQGMDMPTQDALKTAVGAGVKVPSGYVSDNPLYRGFSRGLAATPFVRGDTSENLVKTWNQAVAHTMGEASSDGNLTEDLQNAKIRLSGGVDPSTGKFVNGTFSDLLGGASTDVGKDQTFHADLDNILANNLKTGPFADQKVNEAVLKARALAYNGGNGAGVIDGPTYQRIRTQLGSMAQDAFRGGSSAEGHAFADIQSALDDGVARANPSIAPDLAEARGQYRNFAIISKVAPKDLSGNINPGQLATKMASAAPNEFTFGTNGSASDLADLARFGKSFVPTLTDSAPKITPATLITGDILGAGTLGLGDSLLRGASLPEAGAVGIGAGALGAGALRLANTFVNRPLTADTLLNGAPGRQASSDLLNTVGAAYLAPAARNLRSEVVNDQEQDAKDNPPPAQDAGPLSTLDQIPN